MICQIVCNCGTPIGHLASAFCQARREKMKAVLAMKNEKSDRDETAAINKNDNINMSYYLIVMQSVDMADTLDALHIKNMCCRAKMLTHVRFNDM
jgi:DNA-directed RNA polymerase subunit N (RpoN/RPB10)